MLKEISTEYSLEELMLKLKLQYFGHLLQRPDSLEKTLKMGKIEGRRRRWWQRMRELVRWHHRLNGYELSKLQEIVKDREAWCSIVHGFVMSSTWLSYWTTKDNIKLKTMLFGDNSIGATVSTINIDSKRYSGEQKILTLIHSADRDISLRIKNYRSQNKNYIILYLKWWKTMLRS